MGLDISKITNAELQKLAYTQDNDNNNVLDSKEFTIFKQEALKQNGISTEDFNQAMGLYKTEAAQATEATTKTVKEEKTEVKKELTKDEKKALKQAQSDIKNDIKALIDGKKGARLGEESDVSLENLTTKLAKKNTNSEYKEVIADVKKVVDFVKGTNFNSKKEVEALEKGIKKNDDFNDFQKDLAENMVELAKREQINKEAKVLVDIYNEVRANETKDQNFTAYLDDVKTAIERKNLKNTSYYSDEAFDALEEYVKQDVQEMTKNKRKEMIKNGEKFDSGKKVKNAILHSLSKDDKFARKVAKKEKDMNGVTGRWLDKDRRAEELEKITAKELKDELGEELFNQLNRSYLPTKKNPDGTYNVRELSDAVFKRVGYDVLMNRSDDTQMSELQGVKNELKSLTERDLKDKDIKKIMKLVHIKKEPKDRNLLRALKENIIPAITGSVASASTYSRLKVNQNVNLNMDAQSATEMMNQLNSAGVKYTQANIGDGKINVKISQEVLQDNRALMALAGAGIGVLTGTLMSLIFGMENNEKSCISIADFDLKDERYTNVNNYKDYINKNIKSEAKAKLINALVDALHEKYGDNWAEHYDSMLKKFAGIGSVLNCLEFRAGQLVDVKVDVKKDDDKKVVQSCNVEVRQADNIETTASIDNTYVHRRKKGDGWKGLVDAYYPDLAAKYKGQYYGNNGAIRALQKELCRNDKGVLDEQKLKALYRASDIPKEIKMPVQVEGVDRVIGDVKAENFGGRGKGNYRRPMDRVGRDAISTVKQISPGLYIATDGCDNITASGKTQKEAVQELKKTTKKTYKNEDTYLK